MNCQANSCLTLPEQLPLLTWRLWPRRFLDDEHLAYDVMAAQSDLVEIVHTLHQVICATEARSRLIVLARSQRLIRS
jgi:hypothetical protein